MNYTVRFLIEVLLIQQPQANMIKTVRQIYDEYFVPWSEANLKIVTSYDNFSFYAKYYTERVVKEDGTPKLNTNKVCLFDFSENVLYNKIILHSKELSESKFREWKERLAHKKNTPCDDYDDEVEKLKEQVVNLQKQVKELQQQLQQKPPIIENDGAEKKRKVLNMDKKELKKAVISRNESSSNSQSKQSKRVSRTSHH
jgi:Cu2+-containing amine oxidase